MELTNLLRFEEWAYLKQWLNFRKPKLSDMEYDEELDTLVMDCGLGLLSINKQIVPDNELQRHREFHPSTKEVG